MTRFLTADELAMLHRQEAPSDALADVPGLEAIAARPRQTFDGELLHPTIHHQAAALLHGIATTQYFTDGNKRLALLATVTFYAYNGHKVVWDESDAYGIVIAVANGEIGLDELLDELKHWTVTAPPDYE